MAQMIQILLNSKKFSC